MKCPSSLRRDRFETAHPEASQGRYERQGYRSDEEPGTTVPAPSLNPGPEKFVGTERGLSDQSWRLSQVGTMDTEEAVRFEGNFGDTDPARWDP